MRSCLQLFITIFLAPFFLYADFSSAYLRGSVTDEGGLPIFEVEVIIGFPNGESRTVYTDQTGHFGIDSVDPGEYNFALEKAGFFRLTVPAIRVLEGRNEISLAMNHETELHDSIEVRSSSEIVKPQETEHRSLIVAREIRDIPVQATHDLKSSLPALAEVVKDNTGLLHVAGARSGETQFLLDGFEIGDPVAGEFTARINVDSVRVAEVETGRYETQYGRAGAGVLSLQTAVGDDRWRPGATNFIPGVKIERGLHVSNWYPRLTLSGPIKKGRAWFSEALSVQYTRDVISELPSDSDSVTQWSGDNHFRAQLNLSNRNSLQGSFLFNDRQVDHLGLGALSPISTSRNLQERRSFLSVKDQMWTNSMFFEVGLAADFGSIDSKPMGSEVYVVKPDGWAGNYFENARQNARRWQTTGSMTVPSRRWLGTHDLQFGYNLTYVAWTRMAINNQINIVRADNSLVQSTSFHGPTEFRLSNAEIGMYAQDTWKMAKPLVLQFGLWQDWDRLLQRSAFSPRISANILPFPNERAKLSVAWGIYMQPVLLSIFGPIYGQQREDIFYDHSGEEIVRGPINSRFILSPRQLKQPRFYTTSFGWQQQIGQNDVIGIDYVRRNQRLGFGYENGATTDSALDIVLRNSRQDSYRSLELKVRHSFSAVAEFSASYTRSKAFTNEVLEYGLGTPIFDRQQPGQLAWDTPNRFLSSGWAPANFGGISFSYFFEYRTGYPFSIMSEDQRLVGPPNRMRYPDYFSLNLGIEKRVRSFKRDWAIRLTILNVTNHRNPNAVVNNMNAPNYLEYSGGSKRSFSARFRLIG